MDLSKAISSLEPRPAAYVVADQELTYLYKGSARDLVERLKDHRAGRSTRTKNRRPLMLVHFEYCDSYREALKREKYLKSGYGRIMLKRLAKKMDR